jgi:hypothetical protein
MTHPSLASGLLPIGARSVAFRLPPAHYTGDRKSGSIASDFNSVVFVHTCRNIPTKPLERHPRKNQPDPADDVDGGIHADLLRKTQSRSITC